MNQMTEPSMYDRQPAPDWPVNALPRHWVEALFSKMSAFYGDKFAMMWRGSKIDQVQKAWGIELFKLSREQLKAGSDSLTALPRPPTLPEFIGLCKQARAEQAAQTAPKLENLAPADQKVIEENMAKIRRYSQPMRLSKANPGWAFDMLLSGKASNDQPLSVEVIHSCKQVVLSSAARGYVAAMAPEAAKPYIDLIAKCQAEAS